MFLLLGLALADDYDPQKWAVFELTGVTASNSFRLEDGLKAKTRHSFPTVRHWRSIGGNWAQVEGDFIGQFAYYFARDMDGYVDADEPGYFGSYTEVLRLHGAATSLIELPLGGGMGPSIELAGAAADLHDATGPYVVANNGGIDFGAGWGVLLQPVPGRLLLHGGVTVDKIVGAKEDYGQLGVGRMVRLDGDVAVRATNRLVITAGGSHDRGRVTVDNSSATEDQLHHFSRWALHLGVGVDVKSWSP